MMPPDQTANAVAAASLPALVRSACEDFLYHEAALLDAWDLEAWLNLFCPGATYEVPTASAPDDADPAKSLFYIADDYTRLCHRVRRLMKKEAHSEFPRSNTMRMVGNIRLLGATAAGVRVACKFITYRSKNSLTDCFFGRHLYELRGMPDGIRIGSKRSVIESDNLRPQGRISILL